MKINRNWRKFNFMKLIIESQYFSPVILFKSSFNFSNIVFDQYESYQKMSFRNRCLIAGANGVIALSIPLAEGRDQKKLMKDVRISGSQDWQKKHWKTIVSCYNKSPWFEYYKEELLAVYAKPSAFLIDWNMDCFEWIIKALGVRLAHTCTKAFEKEYGHDTKDCRNKILPKNYSDLGQIIYRQVFEERNGFFPNLSILDLLFCEGKNAKDLLSAGAPDHRID
jgi:hypothetical protein